MDKAGHDGCARPDHAAPEQRPARPEPVTDPTADHLEQQIRIGEGRKHQTKLRVAETQFLLNFAGRGADVYPIDVGDEVHDAQHRQYDMGGLETKPHSTSRTVFLVRSEPNPRDQLLSSRSPCAAPTHSTGCAPRATSSPPPRRRRDA